MTLTTARAPRGPTGATAVIDAPFAMLHNGGDDLSTADTRTELCAALIDGYTDLDDTAATQARIRYTLDCQVRLQAHLVANHADPIDDDHLDLLLGPRADQPVLTEWNHPVPLVCITSFYSPWADTPAPTGNIIWLDPTDETTLLETLHATGVIAVA